MSSRVTLVIAEAGYGKTTLLTDFASRASARCLWYRLDATDTDPVTWTNYLIAAAREVDRTFGKRTLSLLAQAGPGGPPESAFLMSLLSELPRLGATPTILVLDDFHAVDENAQARELVSRLVTAAPPWMHFLIASRVRPQLELARLAGMGEVAEINTTDLRFTAAETERLFRDGYGVTLDPDVVVQVDNRTKGWAASLQMLYGSIRGRPTSAIRVMVRTLSGATGPIYDFLAQEVFKNLPPDVDEFLSRSALLDRVVAGHVGPLFAERRGVAPSEDETRQWMTDAERLGLLARSSESSESSQLHPLLREFLLRRLVHSHGAESIRNMHLALATQIASSEPVVASRHFLEAGDQAAAMECLGRSVILTMGSGQWGMVSSLIDQLEDVRPDPAVAAIRARRLIEDGELPGAADLLGAVDPSGSPPDACGVPTCTVVASLANG